MFGTPTRYLSSDQHCTDMQDLRLADAGAPRESAISLKAVYLPAKIFVGVIIMLERAEMLARGSLSPLKAAA